MTKHIIPRVAAAAFAASVALSVAVPAFAQPGGAPRNNGQPNDSPPLFSGQQDDLRRNDRDDDWRRDESRKRKPDFQQMQRDCSRAGIQEAWNRNFYSAQYNSEPRFHEGRRGWEMRGKMRLHGRSGYSYADTVCSSDRKGVSFEFTR